MCNMRLPSEAYTVGTQCLFCSSSVCVCCVLTLTSRWICDWFKKADKNGDGRMNFKEVRDLLKMMNMDMNEHHALRLFTVTSNT